MGYTTEFVGKLELNYKDNDKMHKSITLINGLSKTRRVKRDLNRISELLDKPVEEYGYEGEFYYDENDFSNFGQSKDISIISSNQPPSNQPGLWLGWVISESDGIYYLEWDGAEKFYYYIQWLEYLINNIFNKNGILLNGDIKWFGEDREDIGVISVTDNNVEILSNIKG